MSDEFENVAWLFFDIGSTLLDETLAYQHRFREIAAAAGVSAAYVTEMAMDFYRLNQKGDREAARRLRVTMPEWHSEDEILYDDAAACLAALYPKHHIGVIANQNCGAGERLERFGIGQYIDLLIASAEAGVAKPDPRIFQLALEQADCPPKYAVMIGDRIDNDIVPAKALGMKTVWVKQGYGQYWQIEDQGERPDRVVDSLTELLALF